MRLVLFGLMAPFAAALIERYGVRRVVLAAIGLIVAGLSLALVMTPALAPGRAVGDRGRRRHRHDGAGARRDRLDALVRRAARPGGRHADRQFGDRATGVPAARRVAGRAHGLALCAAAAVGDRPRARRRAGVAVHARPAVRRRPRRLRRSAPSRRAPPPPAPAFGRRLHACSAKSRRIRRSGCWRRRSSSAGSAPTASSRPISSPCAPTIGMPRSTAASMLAMMGVFDLVGTIGSGWLSDRYDNRALLFWYYGLRGLSLLYLPYSAFTLLRPVAVRACSTGSTGSPRCRRRCGSRAQAFGRERAGVAFGWIFAAHQIGAATAAFGAGLSRSVLRTLSPGVLRRGRDVPRRRGHRLADARRTGEPAAAPQAALATRRGLRPAGQRRALGRSRWRVPSGGGGDPQPQQCRKYAKYI